MHLWWELQAPFTQLDCEHREVARLPGEGGGWVCGLLDIPALQLPQKLNFGMRACVRACVHACACVSARVRNKFKWAARQRTVHCTGVTLPLWATRTTTSSSPTWSLIQSIKRLPTTSNVGSFSTISLDRPWTAKHAQCTSTLTRTFESNSTGAVASLVSTFVSTPESWIIWSWFFFGPVVSTS